MKRLTFFLSLAIIATLAISLIKPLGLAIAIDATHNHAESVAQTMPAKQRTAPLFNNLGNHQHPISTKSKLAQRYFNQGLTFSYGFNHAEAARSFREAAKLDPNCAMCYWGVALVLGPNINAAMEPDALPEAWQAIQKAVELSKTVSAREKAYIQALAKRYPPKPVENRRSYDIVYANAMRDVAKRYPQDMDAATLFVEALMDTMPWDYWTKDGKPKPDTVEILTTLETVLKRNPNHPGANHLYIHAVEASPNPERGIPSADRLGNLVPAAGHLVHMPAHIYIRVGRYHDAVVANQRAVAADQDYITQCHTQGLYPLAYMPHNHHFLLAGAAMGGESKIGMAAARHTAEMVDTKQMRQPGYGTLQHYHMMPLYSLVRFGKWDEVLAQAAPASDLKYPMGVWHYARGLAFLAKGQVNQAPGELEQLQAIAADPALEKVTIWDINSTASLAKIATAVLAGELAAKQGDNAQAIQYLTMAVSLEDALRYDEPAPWMIPTRQSLGAVLLQANRPAEAEAVYREDLKRYPENGWSLLGLSQSLQAQGKTRDAETVRTRFQKAWQYADLEIAASRL
jgi:tetratricopeptide (TPR) repeat protein